jgi:hypothetical protein
MAMATTNTTNIRGTTAEGIVTGITRTMLTTIIITTMASMPIISSLNMIEPIWDKLSNNIKV